jgi:hypothetical protein
MIIFNSVAEVPHSDTVPVPGSRVGIRIDFNPDMDPAFKLNLGLDTDPQSH